MDGNHPQSPSPRNIMDGVNAAMEAPQRDKFPKLWWVIQELRGLDASWHEDGSAPPTKEEVVLYQLLLVHVNSEMSLFHREKLLRLLNPTENKVEFIIKELRDWKNVCIEPSICIGVKHEEGHESEEGSESDSESDYDAFAEEVHDTSAPLELLIKLLEECRHSVAKQSLFEECNLAIAKWELPGRSIPDAMDTSDIEIQGGGSQDATLTPTAAECCAEAVMEDELLDGKEEGTRADTLRNVLFCLENMRRDRAYAPPKADELECYREIRKLFTSSYMYFLAKDVWQDTWEGSVWQKRFSMPGPQCCFAQVIPRICNGKWLVHQIDTDIVLFRPPKGHALELVFDEIPDTQSLLINCKRKLSDSLEGPLEKINSMGTVKHSLNNVKACSGKSVGGKHLRDKLLNIILRAFRRMESLSSTTRPTYREVRLFDRIAEHVAATVDVFSHVSPSKVSQRFRGNLFEAIPRNLDKLDRKMERRAAYLENIMLAVEVINSLYGGTPPTKSQKPIYKSIYRHVRETRKQIYGEEQVHLSADDINIAREVLGIILKRAMDFLCGLKDEYKEMLHMIFTTVPRGLNAVDTFRLLEARKDSAVDELKLRVMASPQGPEILERALLNLQEAHAIHDDLCDKFFRANNEVKRLINEEINHAVLLKELWTAARILQSPRLKQLLSDSKHRPDGVFEVSERS